MKIKIFLLTILPHIWLIFSFGQHDRERNAFRHLAEGKVEKAYFELKHGKKHTDPAEKAFISTLCLLKEGKKNQALAMARQAVEKGLPFDRFLSEPRQWLLPLRELTAFKKWKDRSILPSYSRAYGWSGHRRIRQFLVPNRRAV